MHFIDASSVSRDIMRAKCPKCDAVFEVPWQPTLVHVGSTKYMKCPKCGKRSMMHTSVKDPVNWPEEEGSKLHPAESGGREELEDRIEDSKYERQGP